MKTKMKLGDKIVLTSYGTIITGEKEYEIDDLVNLFYTKGFTVCNFSFNEVKKRFELEYSNNTPELVRSWNINKVYIELSTFHKKLYE